MYTLYTCGRTITVFQHFVWADGYVLTERRSLFGLGDGAEFSCRFRDLGVEQRPDFRGRRGHKASHVARPVRGDRLA